MLHTSRQTINTSNVLSVIMGGGQGTRLFPLTKERAKPAVPLAGKYRLVDIPISNCINSDLRRIYLLTQFNSASLHRHIAQSYKFDHFTGGFVEILAAEPTLSPDTSWYQGTADAVRKNLIHFLNYDWDYLLILSGDALYRMDFRQIIEQHAETNADITVATIPVGRTEAQSLGIMQVDAERRITRFVEKPKDPALLDSLKLSPAWYAALEIKGAGELFLASMGIYVFNREVIGRLLDNTLTDFGKHVIPNAIQNLRVFSFVFQGYWEDIGTIRAFFEANLDVTNELPRFNFFDMSAPVFSRPRYLPRLEDQWRPGGSCGDFRRLHSQSRRHYAQHHRAAQPRGRRHDVEPGDLARLRLLRIARVHPGVPESRQTAHWHRHELPHRKHHRGQERADRQQRGHLSGGQARKGGPHELLHPRRHCGHPQERRHPAWHGDLNAGEPAFTSAPLAGKTLAC